MSDTCPICGGSGIRIVEQNNGNRAVADCACRVLERTHSRLHHARIPERHRECTLENFDLNGLGDHQSLADARRQAVQFVRAYPFDTFGNGLLFVGTCGVGKTHLAVGILQALVAERGVSGCFFDCKELLKRIQSSYSNNNELTERQVLRPALAADVLVLDELGAARKTDWAGDMMEYILNMRYNDRKTTIITTNLAYASAGGGLGATAEAARQESLGDRIGERMFSRLHEMCVVVQMSGPDFRNSPKGRASFAPTLPKRPPMWSPE